MSDQTYRIAVGADHGGVVLKDTVARYLKDKGHEVTDYGTHSKDSVDYADYANEVSIEVANGTFDAGILVCTSGVGVCMAANRHVGIRAVNVRTPEEVIITREHNNANILCLGQNVVDEANVEAMVNAFLNTKFEGGRHEPRLAKASGSALSVADPEVFATVADEGKDSAAISN